MFSGIDIIKQKNFQFFLILLNFDLDIGYVCPSAHCDVPSAFAEPGVSPVVYRVWVRVCLALRGVDRDAEPEVKVFVEVVGVYFDGFSPVAHGYGARVQVGYLECLGVENA